MEQLWAPWRLSYVKGDAPEGCALCAKVDTDDDRGTLVVHRGEHAYVVMNLYPYNSGHLMVVPYRHIADLTDLSDEERLDIDNLTVAGIEVLRAVMAPHGFNVGLNLGIAAGAGIAEHLHWHIVPRWGGDTNFMPVIADLKVMPEHLDATWQQVRDGFAAKEQP